MNSENRLNGVGPITDFREYNVNVVKFLFKKFNLSPKDQGLFRSYEITVDGTKIKAVNSMNRSYSTERQKKTIENIDRKIEKHLYDKD